MHTIAREQNIKLISKSKVGVLVVLSFSMDVRQHFVKSGALKQLARIIKTFSCDLEVCLAALNALKCLMDGTDSCSELRKNQWVDENDGVALILDVLKSHASEAKVCEVACVCLRVLAKDSIARKKACIDAGAKSVLFCVLKIHEKKSAQPSFVNWENLKCTLQ